LDNLTHSLVGWTLGQAGLKKRTRKGLAALILGANAPDIDVFFGWVPWVPLATHRGFTHGLVGGLLLLPPLLAGLLWLLDRWQVRRGARFASGLPMHFGWLLALSYVGCITHPLLDWQTSYAIQLLSPFSSHWFHADSLFIIDIWIILGLGFAIWRSMRREAREDDTWRKPAIAALAVLAVYISANLGVTGLAKRAVHAEEAPKRPDIVVATPPPTLFWRRQLVWRTDGTIGRAEFDPLRSPSRLYAVAPLQPDGMDDPLAQKALNATPEIVRFMHWSILPIAQVERKGCEATVRYNDARFADGMAAGRFWVSATMPSGAQGC